MLKFLGRTVVRLMILELAVVYVCVRWYFPAVPSPVAVRQLTASAPIYKTSEGHRIADPLNSWLIYDKNGEVAFKVSDHYVIYKDGRMVSFGGAAPVPSFSKKEIKTFKKAGAEVLDNAKSVYEKIKESSAGSEY